MNFFLRIFSAATGSFSIGMALHLFGLSVLRHIGTFYVDVLMQASIRNRPITKPLDLFLEM